MAMGSVRVLLLAAACVLSGCVQSSRSGAAPPSVPAIPPAPASTPAPPPHPHAPPTAAPIQVPPPPAVLAPPPNAVVGPTHRGAAGATLLSAASVALLSSSAQHATAGNLDAAAADIERALTLEPSQPRLWLQLGEVRLRQGRRAQARTLAHRAQSLAGGDAGVSAWASDLLRRADG